MKKERIPASDLKSFIKEIMRAHGVDKEQTESVSEILLWCDLVGRSNYGVLRLHIHMERLKHGVLKTPCHPVFKKTADSLELLDGDGGFGHYIGQLAINRAIELARTHGIGVVCVHNSNFFGAGAYYVNQAAQADMIGIVLSNSYPKVTSYGGIKPVLGTNPFTFGAPRQNGHSIMLDMATSAGAGSMVRELIREGLPLPEGIAIDAHGRPITDPRQVASGTLLPFGGAKGYGLALMVEILGGVITGAGISHGVASMYNNFQDSGNNGHFMLVLDISRLMSMQTYYERLESLVSILRESGSDNNILLPGEKRWLNFENNMKNGISLDEKTRKLLLELSEPHGIRPPWE